MLRKLEAIGQIKNATELEQDFIAAIEILFQPETEKQERDLAYASLNRMKRKELGNNDRGYHAYHWLEYGCLKRG